VSCLILAQRIVCSADRQCRNPLRYFRAEGIIRNFNTIDEFRQVDRTALLERAGKTIWEAINDGTIYSCPSLLASFSAMFRGFEEIQVYLSLRIPGSAL
jgi:hypothetical protein